MTKADVQQHVSLKGQPLSLGLFEWDEKTKTFSSNENFLVIDFDGIPNCTFKTGLGCTFKTGYDCTFNTGSGCTFKTGLGCTFKTGSVCTFNTGSVCTFNTGSVCTFNTGSGCTFKTGLGCTFNTGSGCTFKTGLGCTFKTGLGCTFKTGSGCTFNTGSVCTFNTGSGCTFNTEYDCTFKTGYDCTFNTGSGCTFNTGSGCTFKTGKQCAIMRRDIFQIIQPMEHEVIKLCPEYIEGYISMRNGETSFHMTIDDQRIEHVIADNILSRVIRRKGNVYHVINHGEITPSVLVTDGTCWSHGTTLKEAKASLMYKISDRNTDSYKELTLESVLTIEEGVKAYRTITGACESQTRAFVERLPNRKKKYTVTEIIEITDGQYNASAFKQFFSNPSKV